MHFAVNDQADPPVCKIDRLTNVLAQMQEKKKEVKKVVKSRDVKEMHMTGGIEERDFLNKMSKVDTFLSKGHPVKVTILPKKFLKNNRFKDGKRRDRMGGEFKIY